MNPLVYIIILNWNGEEFIIECLKSFSKVKYDNFKILVVDNNSRDNSVNKIKEMFPKVEILELNKNYGFAEGNYKGFESISNKNPEYIIFLNNDTEVDPDFIEPLIKSLKEKSFIGQTVPKIYYSDNKNKIWYAGSKVNLWTGQIKHVGIRKFDSSKYNHSTEADYATGCCFAMRYKDFKDLNGFDQSYPMYCEDVDLSLRLRDLGQTVSFIPESKIYHKISASIGGQFSVQKMFNKIRGYFKLFWRHTTNIQKLTVAIVWLISVPYILLKFIYLKFFHNA